MASLPNVFPSEGLLMADRRAPSFGQLLRLLESMQQAAGATDACLGVAADELGRLERLIRPEPPREVVKLVIQGH